MVFEECPTTKLENEQWRTIIIDNFPLLENVLDAKFLSLKEYIVERPQKFYNKKVFEDYYSFLVKLKIDSPSRLLAIYREIEPELNIAIKSLDEINKLKIHDVFIPDNNIETIRFIEKHIHYSYLTLVEAVFHKFIYLIAYSERLKRNKQVDKLDIYNCVEEVKNSHFRYVTTCYNNTVRNGIAHGGIIYKENETIYKGKKGKPYEIRTKRIVRMFDDLLDNCNGFCIALKLFFILNRRFFVNHNLNIPIHFLISELKAQANAPKWKVVDCLENINLKNQKQLNVFTENTEIDFEQVNYFAFRTAVLAEYFANGYDRYFLSLKSKYSVDGWASYNGGILKRERLLNTGNISGYKGVLEEDLLYFVPKFKVPKIIRKIINLWTIGKINLPIEYHKATNYKFVKKYELREAKPFKRKLFIINNDPSLTLFIDNPKQVIDLIRKDHKKLVRFTIRKSKKELDSRLAKFLRTKFIRVGVYDSDMRVRHLRSSGMVESLVCTIAFNTTQKVRNIDLIGGVVEQIGKYRIVWNKNWTGIKNICN